MQKGGLYWMCYRISFVSTRYKRALAFRLANRNNHLNKNHNNDDDDDDDEIPKQLIIHGLSLILIKL